MQNICIFTGSRAEFGLLKPLIKLFEESTEHHLTLIASGDHLFANNITNVEAKYICENVIFIDMEISEYNSGALTKAAARELSRITDVFSEYKFDLGIVLGDRYEALMFGVAAMMHKLPIAHVHGGEATFGLIDDAIRHSLTKMSYWHFVSTEQYRMRVIQLGESPDRVVNVGALGIDSVSNMVLMNPEQIHNEIGIVLNEKYFVVALHPETLSSREDIYFFTQNLLMNLEKLKLSIVFISVNADPDRDIVNDLVLQVCEKVPGWYRLKNLSQNVYLNLCKNSSGFIGNSSSGILEMPYLGVPSLNIGERQKGRICAPSTYNVAYDDEKLSKVLFDFVTLKETAPKHMYQSPYGTAGASRRIFDAFS